MPCYCVGIEVWETLTGHHHTDWTKVKIKARTAEDAIKEAERKFHIPKSLIKVKKC